jgi:DNA-directed RNA polymerase specialized sigma24 family protein
MQPPSTVEAYSTITRLRPTVTPDHREYPEFNQAYVLIYNYCLRKMRQLSGCQCLPSTDCIHGIRDLASETVVRFDRCVAEGRVIKCPSAYLSQMCRNAWIRAISKRKFQEVEYVEDPRNDVLEFEPNPYREIAESIKFDGESPMSWLAIRDIILECLKNKRLTISETKLFLRHHRDGKKLKDLATFYRTNIASISRQKGQVVLALKNALNGRC